MVFFFFSVFAVDSSFLKYNTYCRTFLISPSLKMCCYFSLLSVILPLAITVSMIVAIWKQCTFNLLLSQSCGLAFIFVFLKRQSAGLGRPQALKNYKNPLSRYDFILNVGTVILFQLLYSILHKVILSKRSQMRCGFQYYKCLISMV